MDHAFLELKPGTHAFRCPAATRSEPSHPTAAGSPFSKGGAPTGAGNWVGRGPGPTVSHCGTLGLCSPGEARKAAEPADKPGSVVDSHSSRRHVTVTLKQPTRTRRGPRHEVPIWSCSRWGLPCRSVARLAVRSYRTISPLPASRKRRRRYLSVALSVGLRRPGVTWHLALWSPDFPRHSRKNDATVWPTPPRVLSHVQHHTGRSFHSAASSW